jgi:hypothetical protein
MAVSYAWTFPTLDVVFDEGNMQNVVETVHWVYTATDGDYVASSYGTVTVPPPEPADFIPYDELTPAIVEGWVEGAMGQDQLDAMDLALANNIAAQQNPTSGPLPPPWNQ